MPPAPPLRIDSYDYRSNDGRVIRGQRGTLHVPMRRDAPGTGTFELAFVRLPAAGGAAGPPTVFLTGGPGLSAIRAGRGRLFPWFDALRGAGDVILLDQRGCGESAPLLRCDAAPRFPLDRVVAPDDVLKAGVGAMRQCADRLRRAGIDLSGLTTVESADDVATLAGALGYERVTLLGWSYGSHLAMSVLKRHESIVARAVLAGPEGPDHTYKLPSHVHAQVEMLAERVRTNDALRAHVPGLAEALRAALARVERRPVRVPLEAGGDAAVGRFDLEWMIAQSLADTRFVPRMPAVFARMARGNFSDAAADPVLLGALRELRAGLFESPVRYCMDCASGATAERRARIDREARTLPLGRTIDWPFPEICEALGNPDLGDAFRAPPRSDLPVLFVTGTLDCRTPAANVGDLAPGFPKSRHLVAEDAGHGDLLVHAGAQREIERFIRDGDIATARAAADPPLAFEPPRPVVLYDAECGFCRARVASLRTRAGAAIDFEPLQEAGAAFPALDPDALRASLHFIGADGRVATGAEAVLRAASPGSGPARVGLWAYRRIPGARMVAEWAYRRVARVRHRISL